MTFILLKQERLEEPWTRGSRTVTCGDSGLPVKIDVFIGGLVECECNEGLDETPRRGQLQYTTRGCAKKKEKAL